MKLTFKSKEQTEKETQKAKERIRPPYKFRAWDGINMHDPDEAMSAVQECGLFYNELSPELKKNIDMQKAAVRSSYASYMLMPKDVQNRHDIQDLMAQHMDAKDPALNLPMEKRIAIMRKMQNLSEQPTPHEEIDRTYEIVPDGDGFMTYAEQKQKNDNLVEFVNQMLAESDHEKQNHAENEQEK